MGWRNFVGSSGTSVPLLTIEAAAPVAYTSLPALTAFIFRNSQTVKEREHFLACGLGTLNDSKSACI